MVILLWALLMAKQRGGGDDGSSSGTDVAGSSGITKQAMSTHANPRLDCTCVPYASFHRVAVIKHIQTDESAASG